VAGSRATKTRESGQARKGAAISVVFRVPRGAQPPFLYIFVIIEML